VTQIAGGGAYVRVLLDCGFPLVALVTRRSLDELGITVGTGIASTFKATAPHLIRRDRIA
jgi:molybdopterin-binding protein